MGWGHPQNPLAFGLAEVLRAIYENDQYGFLNRHKGTAGQREERRTMREPRDENAAATARADYLRANLSPAAGPLETPCLVWRGSSKGGYGDIWHKRRNYRVHRLAYVIANGPIPPGGQVIHSCNNGLCCNPLHLRIRTQR
jgi:HNH endonuclease